MLTATQRLTQITDKVVSSWAPKYSWIRNMKKKERALLLFVQMIIIQYTMAFKAVYYDFKGRKYIVQGEWSLWAVITINSINSYEFYN